MEKKNTVLLTVIAVATLLVAVVGATFAYFTATTAGENNQGTTGVQTTTTVGNVTLDMNPVTVTNELKYPGGHIVAGVKAVAKDTDTANDFNVTYNVNATVTNNTKTALTYALYEVATEVTAPTTGCTVKETVVGTETRYSYDAACAVSATITGGTKVAEGTVDAVGADDVAVVKTIKTEALETLATTNAGTTTYYYLVVDYPDNGNQDADQGKGVVATITELSDAQSARKQ